MFNFKSGSDYSPKFLIPLCAIINTLAGLVYGDLLGVNAFVVDPVEKYYHATFYGHESDDDEIGSLLRGITTASGPLGGLFGAIIIGQVKERLGRKLAMLVVALTGLVGTTLSTTMPMFGLLIAARIIAGMAAGMGSVLCPTYIIENVPREWSGRIGSLLNLGIRIGILGAYLWGWLIHQFLEDNKWRYMYALSGVLSIAQLIVFFIMPESEQWLATRRNKKASGQHLQENNSKTDQAYYRFKKEEHVTSSSIANGESNHEHKHEHGSDTNGSEYESYHNGYYSHITEEEPPLWTKRNIKMIFLGLLLAMDLQFTGTNAIVFFSPRILKHAFSLKVARISTVCLGVWNLMCTIVAFGFVDQLGRRPLLISGLSISALGMAALGFLYGFVHQNLTKGITALVTICLFYVGFNFGIGTLSIPLLVELPWDPRMRSIAVSSLTALTWFCSFLVGNFYLFLENLITPQGTFWIFGGVALVSAIIFYFFLPETKSQSKGKRQTNKDYNPIE
eukprot:gb/GECH01004695.1/.p1 GENE.gb/GECH01004695.1/~~gb/GECH01004695.1/.p1  ORF type:complete len:506 (+),score=72.65 gb/GECH01004695.1/:1-1518(+)